jgi:hypothetical protein
MTAPPAAAPGGIRHLFPIPLVGTAVVLVALLLVTPILFESGPPAPGTYQVQAELIVSVGTAGTEFNVRPVGATVSYESITIGAASDFTWSGTCPSSGLHWTTWQNSTDTTGDILWLTWGTMAMNITATYSTAGGTAIYAAKLAFNVSGGTFSSAACYGATPVGTQPVSNLPMELLLKDWGAGGPP